MIKLLNYHNLGRCNILAEELLKLGQLELKFRQIPNYHLDTRILLCAVLKIENKYFLSDIRVSKRKQEVFFSKIKDRINGKPVSRIISKRNFWNSEFYINDSTLDPRPDSEVLVGSGFELAKIFKKKKLNILELGVGSGCILLSLLKEMPSSSGVGIDIDFNTIMVAKKNAQNLIVGKRAKFLVSNWTNGFKGSFDLIFSNPPYIKTGDIQYLQKEVSKFDPIIALDGGKDGLLCYKKILKNIKNYMANNSFFLLEIDPCLSDHIVSFAKSNNLKLFSTKNDLSGQKRCLIFQKF